MTRLFYIAFTLIRADAFFVLRGLGLMRWWMQPLRLLRKRHRGLRPGQRLALALEKLGPCFVKLGQSLSTRADLIGEELAEDLGMLRDQMAPFDGKIAQRMIEEDLKAPIETLFLHFDFTPVAAASIAQVHTALAPDGRSVAVKVLRPNIEVAFARDLDLFFRLAHRVEKKYPRLKPMQALETFKNSVFYELDLRFEAAAATELAKNMAGDPALHIPVVDWTRTSQRVLTTEWIDGIPIHDTKALKAAGLDLDRIVQVCAEVFFKQVFRDGFFHADLHPGNLFIEPSGRLVAVDFGIMGRLDWKSRLYIARILRGFLSEDYREVADVHFAAGYVPAHHSREQFQMACMAITKPVLHKPLNEISVAALLGQMLKIAQHFEMETQPQLLLMQKTMMMAEGVGRMLNPRLNMWETAKPQIEEWAKDHLGVLGNLRETMQQACELAKRAPEVLRKFEKALDEMGG